MAYPQPGEVHDGYRYEGGDPNSQKSWSFVGNQQAVGGGVSGFDASAQSAKYRDKIATARASSDMKRLDDAQEIEKSAYDNATTSDRARDVLSGDTPTGFMADQRIAAGRAMGGKLSHALSFGFIPTKDQTANLETIQSLGNQGALGQVGQLKGPLSDRDVAFLKSLQYNPGASRTQNQRVVDAQKWVASRQAAYAAALRTWTEKTGSPSALNGKGVSFDRWWGQYAAEHLPPPGISKVGNDDLKARSAQAGAKVADGATVDIFGRPVQ